MRKLDANEISRLNLSRKAKKKRTPSLYDTPLADRTYWGNDPGSEIVKTQVRPEIRRCLKLGHMFDFASDSNVARLSKNDVQELREYELYFMTVLYAMDGLKEFMTADCENFVVVSYNEETNQYDFTIL